MCSLLTCTYIYVSLRKYSILYICVLKLVVRVDVRVCVSAKADRCVVNSLWM